MNYNHLPADNPPGTIHYTMDYSDELNNKFQHLTMAYPYHPPFPPYNYPPIHTQPAYPLYTPQHDHHFDPLPIPYPTSPMVPSPPFLSRPSTSNTWASPPMSPVVNRRDQWNSPFAFQPPAVPHGFRPRPHVEHAERKPYHPQAPATRSDWVMWVGNVPSNTSHEELWRYFNATIPQPTHMEDPWRGPSSIFLISRSSCAFVNLSSQLDLDRAVSFFNGKSLRPWDPKCPRLVCRIRRKDDDLRAGVGAQRGTGMHREWVKKNVQPPSPAILEHPPEGEGRRRESVVDARHHSSASMASTNSSFLTKHFPRRIFILKSTTTAELEESVKTGTWRLQKHNEPILDQAYRTAQEVFLIFSANGSGEFFGYAKMIEAIDKEKAASRASRSSYKSSSATIDEERPSLFISSSQSRIASSSPGEMTPGFYEEITRRGERRTESPPARMKGSADHISIASAPARARTHPVKDSYFPPNPRSSEGDAKLQEVRGGSNREQQLDDNGVLRKDTVRTPEIKPEDKPQEPPDARGELFKIEWVKVGSLPFSRTRQYRNPWNQDREVKVSRDGTELEPGVGTRLMAEWDEPSQ